MSYTTPTELALLRTQPHETKLYLSIYQPNVILSGRVNDADIARGERVITWDGCEQAIPGSVTGTVDDYVQVSGVADEGWFDNLENAFDDNGDYATYSHNNTYSGTEVIRYYLAANSIPTNAIIQGVKVTIWRKTQLGALLKRMRDTQAVLVNGASVISNDKADGSAWPTGTGLTKGPIPDVYGDSDDLWGATLTPAIINSGDFGFQFQAETFDVGAGGCNALIHYIHIDIYYSIPEAPWNLVEDGMVLLVGTTHGGDEKGRLRIRSATSTELTVAENYHIEWADNDYLTVLNFFEVTSVFQRIIQGSDDGSDPDLNVIFYKDYDIAYSNQNAVLGAFPCMGCHHAEFLENGQAQIYYTASGTFHVLNDPLDNSGSETMSYHWWFQGATVTGSHVMTPGYITYDTPGHYTTRLIVSGSSGSVDVSYRHISIYDRPENGINNPILSWEVSNFDGDRDQGGYSGNIRIRQSIPESIIRDGALVVIFADDWYGTTKQSIGGNAENRQKIVFVGYVKDGTITYNYRESYVEFEIVSPTGIMQLIEAFSISIDSVVTPSKWYQVADLTTVRALYHYLRWHSTVLKCNDLQVIGIGNRLKNFDADRQSIYDGANTLVQGCEFGSVVCDRQGKAWVEQDIFISTGSFSQAMSLGKPDWMGDPIIVERQSIACSYLETGGVFYDGPSTDQFEAFMANSPGDYPHYRGQIERIQGLALNSQEQLNEWTGNLYAYRNSRYPSIDFELVGNFRNLDIAPQETIGITMNSLDTNRGIEFNNKLFTLRSMSWTFDSERLVLLPTINVSELVSGVDAVTIPIPDAPPTAGDGGGGGGGFYLPPIWYPPLPVPTPKTPVPDLPQYSVKLEGSHTIAFADGPVDIPALTDVNAYDYGSMWPHPNYPLLDYRVYPPVKGVYFFNLKVRFLFINGEPCSADGLVAAYLAMNVVSDDETVSKTEWSGGYDISMSDPMTFEMSGIIRSIGADPGDRYIQIDSQALTTRICGSSNMTVAIEFSVALFHEVTE